MARLSEEEIKEIRKRLNIKEEDIGPMPQHKRRKPNGKKPPAAPEWLSMAFA